MNWLERMSQVWTPMALTSDQMVQIINDVLINQGGDINYAAQKFQENAPLPEEICITINEAAGTNAAARPKMQQLAEAGGCYWNPTNPPGEQAQVQPTPEMTELPMMGQQEKPMDMPSAEFE